MPTVYLICGRICSGKTHFADMICKSKNAKLLSCDDITLKYEANHFDEFLEETKSKLLIDAVDLLKSNKNVVLDWGFWTKPERLYTMDYFKNKGYHTFLIYIDVDKNTQAKYIIKRNQNSHYYYVDEGLLNKCNSLFEAPDEEIDFCVRNSNQIDRSIAYKNIIMKCDCFDTIYNFPAGIKIRNYRDGDETHWANIEYAIGDFDSIDSSKQYFIEHYKTNDIYERCFFAEDNNQNVIGTCIAWYDKKGNATVSSLHWLAVLPEYQNKGIGKVLLSSAMNYYKSKNLFPVYLHTQPWSYKAIRLYNSFGFQIQKEDTFADYINEYNEAIEILKRYLPEIL